MRDALSAGRPRRGVGEVQAESLAVSSVPGDGEGIGRRGVKNHQLNQTQEDDLLKQAKKEDAYLPADAGRDSARQTLLRQSRKGGAAQCHGQMGNARLSRPGQLSRVD